MSLKEYTRKRDFKKTAEPGAVPGKGEGRRFVIQKHAASRLHYDFRLEVDGVLKSWAVPKGIPTVKAEKRLAVHVEDHPVSYINFEGTIPKGQYGGGTVMVWDRGTFSTDVKSPAEELERGKLHFTLSGKKLQGEWYLVRLRDGDQWLLIKGGEDLKPIPKKLVDVSVLSGKTMEQISGNGEVWQSKPRQPETKLKAFARQVKKKVAIKIAPGKFIPPMKARLTKTAPAGNDRIYEIKFDGYWTRALKEGGDVFLMSQNQNDFNEKFPEIVEAVGQLKVRRANLEGEIVALDPKGISSFQMLQSCNLGSERPPIFFYAFDLLSLNGKDLRELPLTERKQRLEELLQNKSGLVRYSASLGDDPKPLLKMARTHGLEGLIGKLKDSTYESGQRSGAWIKLKLHQEQEFVIGGYTEPEGSRQHFGALLVGFYEKKLLKFCGKVGTGFDARLLKSLFEQFQKIASDTCPFVNLPESRRGRYGAGVTASEMKRCHWLQPRLVCQVKFSEWTQEAKLRQPVFLGLREDKNAGEVIREKAV